VSGKLSIVLPAFNERESLSELLPELVAVLDGIGHSYEVLVVDDGSTDGTRGLVEDLDIRGVSCVRLRRNSGKSAAVSVGIEHAQGDIVVLMDADGQDDPSELPKLLAAIDDGAELVTGQRSTRNDRFVKRHTSKVYNASTRLLTGVEGRDFNSGYKAMTAELARSLELYGELHRYIPVLAAWQGFTVVEVPVCHRARSHGTTKFGPVRFWRGFLDLITVKFLTQYTSRPFHLFGSIGFVLFAAGSVVLTWLLALKVTGSAIGDRPALIAGVLLAVVGVQMISLGLLAELVVNLRRRRNLDVTVEAP
jgi:glycosyltransferase involved in cell wall biosynthesis